MHVSLFALQGLPEDTFVGRRQELADIPSEDVSFACCVLRLHMSVQVLNEVTFILVVPEYTCWRGKVGHGERGTEDTPSSLVS